LTQPCAAEYIRKQFRSAHFMPTDSSRRQFLLHSVTGLSAVWVSANWPALLAAADHARHQAKSAIPHKLEFFQPDEAVEIEAVTARIIPTDDTTPGAREAGVVYFIDRALVTFAKDQQKLYRDGLPALQSLTIKMFPGVPKFSDAKPEQQDEILRSFGGPVQGQPNPFMAGGDATDFFETLRAHTIAGFLIDPDTRGNPNGVGWKLIGRDREHTFQPPFGYYDKDYPGWQPAPAAAKDGAGK
jgi:gluconate 2-dehydrogenase gamma chain